MQRSCVNVPRDTFSLTRVGLLMKTLILLVMMSFSLLKCGSSPPPRGTSSPVNVGSEQSDSDTSTGDETSKISIGEVTSEEDVSDSDELEFLEGDISPVDDSSDPSGGDHPASQPNAKTASRRAARPP